VKDLVERFTVDELLDPNAGIRVLRPQLRRVGVHWHDFYELGYVLDGTAQHVVNGLTYPLSHGSVFLLSPADFHELRPTSSNPLTCYNVVIDPLVLERQFDEISLTGTAWLPWSANGLELLEADFRRLWEESRSPQLGAGSLMESVLRCVVIELARRCSPSHGHEKLEGHPRSEVALSRAVSYVDRHFREPVTLADAAAQAHLSPNYFSERFGQFTGVSFQAYLQDRRLRFARSLLAATGLGVSEVCHAAGFNNSSHFGRAYRRRFGAAPSAGRRRERLAALAVPAPLSEPEML
jgi:AraC-like DNA-binding protein